MYIVWSRSPALLFPIWISSCPSTFCWKDFFLYWMFWYPSWKATNHKCNGLFLNSLFHWSVCLDYNCFVVSSEIRMCESFSFVLLFSRLFLLHWVSWISIWILGSTCQYWQKRHLGSWLGLPWKCHEDKLAI